MLIKFASSLPLYMMRFFNFLARNCNYLVTSSFDKTATLWGHPIWAPIRTLQGHNSKVVYADISPDNKYIATCSHDLTYKLWSRDTDI